MLGEDERAQLLTKAQATEAVATTKSCRWMAPRETKKPANEMLTRPTKWPRLWANAENVSDEVKEQR